MARKIVGVSGAQGGGKSTLLLGLKAKGWYVDDFRVSRAVQAQLEWNSLDRVMDSVQTMQQFQEEVIAQKFKREKFLLDAFQGEAGSPQIILTERTFADIAAYTSHWCWEHVDRRNWTLPEAMDWLGSYTNKCRIYQDVYEAVVLLPYMKNIPWQNDAQRAAPHFRDSIYEDVVRFTDRRGITMKRHEIRCESIEDRINEVDAFLRTL